MRLKHAALLLDGALEIGVTSVKPTIVHTELKVAGKPTTTNLILFNGSGRIQRSCHCPSSWLAVAQVIGPLSGNRSRIQVTFCRFCACILPSPSLVSAARGSTTVSVAPTSIASFLSSALVDPGAHRLRMRRSRRRQRTFAVESCKWSNGPLSSLPLMYPRFLR